MPVSDPVPRALLDASVLPAKDRGKQFHRMLLPLFHSVPREKGPDYQGSIEVFRVGDTMLTKSHLGAATFERKGTALADGIDMYGIQVFVQGQTEMTQATHRGHRGPDGLVILDMAQPLENGTGDALTYNLSVPRRVLAPLLREPDVHHGRFLRRESPLATLALEHFRAVFEELPRLTRAEAQVAIGPAIALVAATLNSVGRSSRPAPELVAASDALRVRSYISSHFTDPSLTVGTLGERLSISRKRLACMFHEEGGPAAFIQRRRLELARRWLLDRHGRPLPVADIGARAGFGSDATFFRVFKKAFGASPSDVRESEQEPTLPETTDWFAVF